MRQLELRGKKLSKAEYKKLLPRGDFSVADAMIKIAPILDKVAGGSEADLLEISQQLDGIKPKSIRVEKGELEKALATLPNDIKKSLNLAIQQVSKYHKTQLPIDTKNQVIAGGEIDRRWVAVDRVGAT